MEVGRLRWGQLLRDLAWALTTVVAGNDVGQYCCRAVKDLRTKHDVNRTIYLPSHCTISALLEGLGRLPFWTVDDLAGVSRRAAVSWTTGARGWWGCHIRLPLGSGGAATQLGHDRPCAEGPILVIWGRLK